MYFPAVAPPLARTSSGLEARTPNKLKTAAEEDVTKARRESASAWREVDGLVVIDFEGAMEKAEEVARDARKIAPTFIFCLRKTEVLSPQLIVECNFNEAEKDTRK